MIQGQGCRGHVEASLTPLSEVFWIELTMTYEGGHLLWSKITPYIKSPWCLAGFNLFAVCHSSTDCWLFFGHKLVKLSWILVIFPKKLTICSLVFKIITINWLLQISEYCKHDITRSWIFSDGRGLLYAATVIFNQLGSIVSKVS